MNPGMQPRPPMPGVPGPYPGAPMMQPPPGAGLGPAPVRPAGPGVAPPMRPAVPGGPPSSLVGQMQGMQLQSAPGGAPPVQPPGGMGPRPPMGAGGASAVPPPPSGDGMQPPRGSTGQAPPPMSQPAGPQMYQAAPPSFGAPPKRVYPTGAGAYAPPPPGPPTGMPPPQSGFSQPPPAPFASQAAPPSVPYSPQPPAAPSPSREQTAPAYPPAGAPRSSAPSSMPRIDPSQIPRPVPVISSAPFVFQTRVNGQANCPPPLSSSNFIVRDTGNCSPRVMRSTVAQLPHAPDLASCSGLSMGILVTPFAVPHPEEEPIPVVDFGETGPIRCGRCKAYINPFMKFVDQGRQFTCNMCGFNNDVPVEYFCNLGPDGVRRDMEQRPELCRGSVEFVAPSEYMVRPPMPAVFFFLIDVSFQAVNSGALTAICSYIKQLLDDVPNHETARVGIATFDSTIHYYNLSPGLSQAQMMVMAAIKDPFCPYHKNLVVPLRECKGLLEGLLDSLPLIFQNSRSTETCPASAIKGAFSALKDTGGKLFLFASALPSAGIGILSVREGATNVSDKDEVKLLQCVDQEYLLLARSCAEYQICVDLFLTVQSYVDVATLSTLSTTTGGQVYHYCPFSPVVDGGKLYNDLRWNLKRPQGMEAVMRVRCSQGLQVQEYFGNFCQRSDTDVDLPAIDCDKSILVTFKLTEVLAEHMEACFQCAVLYTTTDGHRRIRVHTLSLPTAGSLPGVYKMADMDALFAVMVKQGVQKAALQTLAQLREGAVSTCVNTLHAYRKFCATTSAAGQLILPEALKLMPLYTLALTKSLGLRANTRLDDRAHWMGRMRYLPPSLCVATVYPRMFAIHTLSQQGSGEVLPPLVSLSSENLDPDGMFLLENGENAFLWVGKSARREQVQQLFGVDSIDAIKPNQFQLQEFDNDLSRQLNRIVNEIRLQRCSYLRLRLVKKSDPLEGIFFSYLVEDRVDQAGMSYVEFLCHVHRQIQNKFSL
eukprot:jgi/Mesvir1/20948/Mv08019-RA.1